MKHIGNAARLLTVSLALSLGLGGCFFGGKAKEEAAEQPTETQQSQDPRRAVGDATEPAYEVSLVNGCDVAIETLALRPVGSLDYAGDLLAGAPIAANEEVVLRVAQEGAAQAYDMRATAAGGTVTYEFVGVPVPTVTQVFLHIAEDGQAYVDYVAPDGTVSSTKDYLVAQTKTTPAETKESAAPVAAAESQESTPETVAVAASSETTYYDDDDDYYEAASDTYEAPAETYEYDTYEETYAEVPMEAPAATEQTADACVDDVMLK